MPLVSVIIPTHNAAGYVGEAAQSALSQTYPRLEVLIVDDGSTDDTEQTLRPLADRVTFIRQPHRGPAAARNTAIRQAHGELIAFLDADDIWFPEKVAVQVAHLLDHPHCALVHCDLLYRDNDSTNLIPSECDRAQFRGQCYRNLFFSNHIVPSTVLMKKDVALRLGLFDEAAEVQGCEDYDLWMRVARRHEVGYIPRPMTIYRRHAANISRNLVQMTRAELTVMKKALQQDPNIVSQIGQAPVDGRLNELYSHLGYLHWDAGNLTAARMYLRQALQLNPRDFYHRAVWCATFVPGPCIKWARTLKQMLSKRVRRRAALRPAPSRLTLHNVDAPLDCVSTEDGMSELISQEKMAD